AAGDQRSREGEYENDGEEPVEAASMEWNVATQPRNPGTLAVRAYPAHMRNRIQVDLDWLHADCGQRIHYQKACPVHGEVEKDEVVTGYKLGPSAGRYRFVSFHTVSPGKRGGSLCPVSYRCCSWWAVLSRSPVANKVTRAARVPIRATAS